MTRPEYEVLADRFINAIEEFREMMERRYHQKFHGAGHALRVARDKHNSTVERNYPFLDLCVDLRNSIQHEKVENGQPVASPRPDVVEKLERLVAQIDNPPRINDHMIEPVHLPPTAPLSQLAALIEESDFSQIPIYDQQGYNALVTTNMLARWLSHCVNQGKGDLIVESATVADILPFAEAGDKPAFVTPQKTALTVCNRLSNNDAPPAILVTDNGAADGKLLGLVTRFDVPEILRALQV